MTLTDVLIPRLLDRFPGRGLRTGSLTGAPSPRSPCAVFPAVHPEVGDIQIFDDGDELTVVAGNFTHGHFECYDINTKDPARSEQIVANIVAFLEDLFSDRMVLWGSHKGSGGWYARGDREGTELVDEFRDATGGGRPRLYVWSGPLE
jgi:hypothetical protein